MMGETQDEQDGMPPCPVCGRREECEHYLVWDDFLSDFADGLPTDLADRLVAIEDEQEEAILATASPPLRVLFAAVAPDEKYGDASNAYWTGYPDVIADFFDEGGPGTSGYAFYHPDGSAFTERVRQEAAQGIAWLDENLPMLRERAASADA